MYYLNYQDLVRDVSDWCRTMSTDFDVVVGIPRSGMIVASLIAAKFGKPLSSSDLFAQQRYWGISTINFNSPVGRILLVDDTSSTGYSMDRAYNAIKLKFPDLEIIKAALYISINRRPYVDRFYRLIPEDYHQNRFEWNMAHVKLNIFDVVDMDGVLCENCPVNDLDENAYVNWIRNAKPHLIPTYKINIIATSRIEKYRSITEEWLKEHGVKYNKLIMWGLSSNAERGNHVRYKVDILRNIDSDNRTINYWESELGLAIGIREELKDRKDIFIICIENMQML